MAIPPQTGQEWAAVIMRGASDSETAEVVDAINALTRQHRAKLGSVMIACAQILAQSIVDAPPDVTPEVRAGIMSLINGFAIQFATIKEP